MTERLEKFIEDCPKGSGNSRASMQIETMLGTDHKVHPYRTDIAAVKKAIKDWAEKQLTYRG